MNKKQALELLSKDMPWHQRRLDAAYLETIAAGFPAWFASQERQLQAGAASLLLARYLLGEVKAVLRGIELEKVRQGEFTQSHARTTLEEEKQQVILDQLRAMGSSRRQLAEDKRAFGRWFGMDAMNDRYRLRLSRHERKLVVLLKRLGVMVASSLAETPAEAASNWRLLALEENLQESLVYAGNTLIREAAFNCLAAALLALPASWRESALGEATVRFIYRMALEARQEVWLQCDALNLLRATASGNFIIAARRRLQYPGEGDDLFVRRRLVLWLADLPNTDAAQAELLTLAASDSSPYVRQAVASSLPKLDQVVVASLLPGLLQTDAVPQVRAAAALALAELAPAIARPALLAALAEEKDSFVLRVLMRVAPACLPKADVAATEGGDFLVALLAVLDRVHATAADLKVRRWAAQAGERLWAASDQEAMPYWAALRQVISTCPPGKSVRLPAQFNALSGPLLARMLAVLAQEDYNLDLEKTRRGWRLWRGHRFAFRLWRWLHEMRYPSPDKRQAFRHTIGRIFRGSYHAPSGILAELAETKVPGEPLQIGSEGGWRPYLPLVDELISALDEDFSSGPVCIHTAEGITEITCPPGLLARLRARSRLTRDFVHYARLRNWQEGAQSEPGQYLAEIRDLGFAIRFLPQPTGNFAVDPAVGRFFPTALALDPELADFWQRFKNYFFSVFENTLFELAVFCGASMFFFIVRHLYLNRLIRRARANIPLSVGGWGTRGKSGTERIKAALFNAMGYSVVSKTTGCEAMFLYGRAYEELREMFLFRPYDKATIWEQHNVVCLAEKLGGEVFLWECMALTPAFVQLLQRRWMRDDIVTITNTFPDHEDLQGPAGINIPEVMTNFIPEKRTLLTSEEQMRPILRTAADALGTRLRGVGWLESGLLAPDVLARFPYQEHPDNIALVIALADELGVSEDFALKAMADRVVADLGVLKVYPAAHIDGRRVSFVNGMSANERFGCLGNWRRLGFDRLTLEDNPDIVISTVVNNRADRVARSRVFAGILVDDIAADFHFLIGSNLAGLQGYVRESWQLSMQEVTLWPEGKAEAPLTVLAEFARRLRVPASEAAVQQRLQAMLQGQGITLPAEELAAWRDSARLAAALTAAGCQRGEETLAALAESARSLDEYQAFAARLGEGGERGALDASFRELLWQWFQHKIVVIEDYHATGNQIIQLIASRTPPGLENKVMGIQNIKGTGLDFVYRWQAWDNCYRACELLNSDEMSVVERGLAALAAFGEYGVLCEEKVLQSLAAVTQRGGIQERHLAEIDLIRSSLQNAMSEIRQSMQLQRSTGWLEQFIGAIEGFFDAGDAVKRRRIANQIYADMVTQHISHARAAVELQALNKRQKGGWLYADLQKFLRPLLARWPRRAGDGEAS